MRDVVKKMCDELTAHGVVFSLSEVKKLTDAQVNCVLEMIASCKEPSVIASFIATASRCSVNISSEDVAKQNDDHQVYVDEDKLKSDANVVGLFGVFDRQSNFIRSWFFCDNEVQARRFFKLSASKLDADIVLSPEDFDLVLLAALGRSGLVQPLASRVVFNFAELFDKQLDK
ncbi:hypothetical protein [Capybara microvirus Cap3_SP_442]|nr:hypothetical protein [Capybara microvirus Cap3_SP_442]